MKLKIKRIDRGMTLERMADKLGITIVTYRSWEMDPRKITVENAKKICLDRKSTRLNSSHLKLSRMPSSA